MKDHSVTIIDADGVLANGFKNEPDTFTEVTGLFVFVDEFGKPMDATWYCIENS